MSTVSYRICAKHCAKSGLFATQCRIFFSCLLLFVVVKTRSTEVVERQGGSCDHTARPRCIALMFFGSYGTEITRLVVCGLTTGALGSVGVERKLDVVFLLPTRSQCSRPCHTSPMVGGGWRLATNSSTRHVNAPAKIIYPGRSRAGISIRKGVLIDTGTKSVIDVIDV